MSLVPSLLQAIVQVDGEALVMHAGDTPYVVTPNGQVDLASRGLTLEAVNGIVSQLLPPEVLHALDEFGAAQYQLPPRPDFPQEQFTVVAARGGDDLWAEIRRRRIPDEDHIPEEIFGPAATAGSSHHAAAIAHAASEARSVEEPSVEASIDSDTDAYEMTAVSSAATAEFDVEDAVASGVQDDGLALADPVHLSGGGDETVERVPTADANVELPPDGYQIDLDEPDVIEPVAEPTPPAAARTVPPPAPAREIQARPPTPVREMQTPPRMEPAASPRDPSPASAPVVREPAAASIDTRPQAPAPSPHLVQPEPPQPAVVLPMTRNPIRPEPPATVTGQSGSGLDRLLRLAAARGASTLYLATDARPSVRVDGENQALEGEPTLTSYDVESLLLTLMPERSHEALRTGAATEWICDIEEVGRVRCMSFRDHRGPGGVFRLMAGRAVSMDQLALSPEIQALAIEPEGLVLVVGPRSSGKRTLISAFTDLINRTRRDHVISIESEINVVHDRGTSFISQREVRGSNEDVLAAARGALREDPDVLVIEDLRTGALMNVAIEAAASGHLVIGGFSAHSATGAIDRIIDLYAPEYRRQIQMALAQQVRGVVAQVLLRKNGGGRLAARELLLNTPAVASVIAEGKTSQLPMAIEGGRRHGMVPLNDALVGFVQSGAVDAGEAYRRASDRAGFLSLLKRQGIDTTSIERFG